VKLAVALVLIVLGGWAWTHHRHGEMEHKLSEVATSLAGRPVKVRCQGFVSSMLDINWRAGEVQYDEYGRPGDHAFLTRRTCRELNEFDPSSARRKLDCLLSVDWSRWTMQADYYSPCAKRARPAVLAITVLAHEAMHLRGWVNEAQAQCYAIQEAAWTAVRLGATPEQARAVASFALAQQPGMPSDYQSSDCRAGGRLDLAPATPGFPAEDVPRLPPAAMHGPALVR
jgi:hypothetical protein